MPQPNTTPASPLTRALWARMRLRELHEQAMSTCDADEFESALDGIAFLNSLLPELDAQVRVSRRESPRYVAMSARVDSVVMAAEAVMGGAT